MKKRNKNETTKPGVRPDLSEGSQGKDLSYLNEMPQMGGYEGVKAGVPPAEARNEKKSDKSRTKK